MNILGWAKDHPWEAGGIAFVGGIAVLYLLGMFKGGSSSSSNTTDPNVAAYYQAEAAQAAAGDQLQATQIAATAQTAQTISTNQANVDINNTWATNQTQQDLINQVGALANDTGTVLTDTTTSNNSAVWGPSGSSGSGLFGLFSGSTYNGGAGNQQTYTHSTQTIAANAEQATGAGLLASLVNGGGYHAAH